MKSKSPPAESDTGSPTKREVVKGRLAKIYGEEIASHNWFALPHALFPIMGWLLKDDKLSYQEAYTLLILLRLKYVSRSEDPLISYKKLGSFLGVEERRMRDVINSLEKKGMLSRGKSKRSRANVYDLDPLMVRLQTIYPRWASTQKKKSDRA